MVVSPLIALSFKAVAPMLCLPLASPADLPTDAGALLLDLAAPSLDVGLPFDADAWPSEADVLLAASLLALPEALPLGVDVLPLGVDALLGEAASLAADLRTLPPCSSFWDSA